MSQDPKNPPPPPAKAPEVDAVTGPAPLGMAAFPDGLPQLTPADKIKGAPDDYWHGSATGEVNYWRSRAKAAEERLRLRFAELEAEKKRNEKLVVVESPYAGDIPRNVAYLDALLKELLHRGLYPYASHRFFPGILNDDIPSERKLGIEAGLAWGRRAYRTIVGVNLGISPGMKLGIDAARVEGREVEEVSLEGWKK